MTHIADDNQPAARVTLGMIYQAQIEQGAKIADLVGMVNLLTDKGGSVVRAIDDHEQRIRDLNAHKTNVDFSKDVSERVKGLEQTAVTRSTFYTVTGLLLTFVLVALAVINTGNSIWGGS